MDDTPGREAPVRWPLKMLLLLVTAALGAQLLEPLFQLVPACWSVTPISRPCLLNAGVALLFVQLLLGGCLGSWLGRPWGALLWIVATMALPAGSVSTPLRLLAMALALGLGIYHGWRLWGAGRLWRLGALAGGSLVGGLVLLFALHLPTGSQLEMDIVDAGWRAVKGADEPHREVQMEVIFRNAGARSMRLDLPDEDTYLPMEPLLQIAARDAEGRPLAFVAPRLCGNAYSWRRVSSVTLGPGESARRSLTLLEHFVRPGAKASTLPATLRLRYDSSAVSLRGWHFLQTFARRPAFSKIRSTSPWTRLLLQRPRRQAN